MVYTKEFKLVEVIAEGGQEVLKLNYDSVPYIPSIEDNPLVMMDAIDKLIENPSVSRIIFLQKRNYGYNDEQTKMLIEIANIYSYFIKSKKATSLQNLGLQGDSPKVLGQRLSAIQYIMLTLLKQDPLAAYAEVKRTIRREVIVQKTTPEGTSKNSLAIFIKILEDILTQLDKTLLIAQAREYIAGYTPGDREVYKLLFRPTITPDFMYTKIAASPPLDGEQVDIYKINESTDVGIYRTPEEIKNIYHITPPEFKISEDKFELIDLAKKVLSEHQPRAEEFLDPSKMRASFTNIGCDLLRELAEQRGLLLRPEEVEEMAEILVRHTIGFGIVELLLEDERVQDITINSPMGQVPIFLLHEEHNECTTNITPSTTDFESWATKFRLLSGRPLDEANPILDTEIILPKSRSRLSVIGKPLNPYGYGMSFRRHRDTPWTLPLFIKNGMISPLGAGLLSFTIDGARTHLIAGTRSSGKTSFLTSLLLEIMRRYRVLTIEDSVSGDSEILIRERNTLQKVRIRDLVDGVLEKNGSWYNLTGHEISGNTTSLEILSMDKNGKISFSKISKFIRHKVEKSMYYIKTATGREIEVTSDHSLFSLNEEGCIAELKPSVLKGGEFIATPRKISNYNNYQEKINILNFKLKFTELYFQGGNLQEFLFQNRELVKKIGKEQGYERGQVTKWIRIGLIPGKVLEDITFYDISLNQLKGLKWKKGNNSQWLPIEIYFDDNFLTFIGLWLADGCYDQNSVLLSVGSKEEIEVVQSIAKRFGFGTHYHSDAFTLMIHSGTMKFLLRDVLELKGDAYTKRVPSWVFNLSNKQIGFVLKGMFSGDGCVTEKEIVISLCSKQLVKDIQTLLLFYGVIFRIGKQREKDKCYPCRISNIKSFRAFRDGIGILQFYKRTLLERLCCKESTHDISDIIPLSILFKKKMKMAIANFNSNDYISRENNIGREKLFAINRELVGCVELSEQLQILATSDLLWDKVKEIKVLPLKEQYVYDLSVPENESFVCNNIVAHNTLEIPTEEMRKLGYNIQPLKVRAALSKSGSEVAADEGIRTSLRLGDSALIVGEVRSSIRGSEEVFIVDKGKAERVAIESLEGRDISEMYVPTMDMDLKFKLKKVIAFVKHPKRGRLLEVTTKTGRKVTVTPDHSLFTQKDFRILPIECKDLAIGSKIVIPERIPCGYNDSLKINLFDLLDDENCKLDGYDEDLRQIIQKIGWKKASEIADTNNDIYMYMRKGVQHNNIPISIFKNLAKEANHGYNLSTFQIKKGTSKTLDAEIEVSKDFCRFLGYYASEGYTQKESSVVVFSNRNPKIIEDIISLSNNLFNITPFVRETKSLGISTQISLSNKILGLLLSRLGCGRLSTEKRVPSFIFGLSEEKICEFLKGYFDGDGCQLVSESSGNEISASTVSKGLANDLLHLLMCLGIVARIEKGTLSDIGKHESYVLVFKQRKYVQIFLEKVGFQKYTKEIITKQTPHSTFNTIDYDPQILEEHVKIKRVYRHLRRFNSCGKDYLRNVVNEAEWASEHIKSFVNGEFYLDEVKEIKEVILDQDEYVYDLSVQPCQNFIGGFGGIMLHNTEALALYEAMRIGASANVVAGTIHGDSPYGVFDRVVNDLKVPKTSFKATDIIVMCNPIHTADGLKKVRRVLQITEVRKEWETDPIVERGFVDLMKYNAKTDQLEPTTELVNGESDVLKAIGANVREWVGNWDAIWDNIVLRGELKKMLVDYSNKTKIPSLLEAKFSLQGNDMFHRISQSVHQEVGALDSKRIKEDWEEWLKKEIRRKQLG